MISPQDPTCLLKINAWLGEVPVWSKEENCLYWLDVLRGKIHCFNPETRTNSTLEMNQLVASLGLRRGGGFILALFNKIALFHPQKESLEIIGEIGREFSENRFNDGKCDRKGRFWCTTKNEADFSKNTGGLYKVDHDHRLHFIKGDIVTGNGMGWSPDNRLFYFTETLRHTIFVYDFDLETGSIDNQRVFVHIDPNLGLPDGLTVDVEGCIWTALYGKGYVIRYTPEGQMDRKIALPAAPHVTNCTFGGKMLETLYITTAQEGMSEEQIQKYPLSGSLFALNPGVKGMPESYYRG